MKGVIEFFNECSHEDTCIKSPVLTGKSAKDQIMKWYICVGVTGVPEGKKANWKSMLSLPVIPDRCKVWYYTVSWKILKNGEAGKELVSEKTHIHTGKNIGKKNQTNAFTQAISDALGIYNKKLKSGYFTQNDAFGSKVDFAGLLASGREKVAMMALHLFTKYSGKVKYPAYAQVKMDGTAMIVLIYLVGDEVRHICFSRGRELMPVFTYVAEAIVAKVDRDYLGSLPGKHIYFVGELWESGKTLQYISGLSRKKEEIDEKIPYNIFDCFNIDKEFAIEDRIEILNKLLMQCDSSEYVKLIEHIKVNDVGELQEYYHKCLSEGYEGAVVRSAGSLYRWSISKEIRSSDSLKLKPRPDGDYPIVGYGCGEGKESDQIIWTLCENDDGVVKRTGELLPYDNRLVFRCTPNSTQVERRCWLKLFTQEGFFEKVKYSLVEVEYSILSDNYLPQQPKAIRFKNEKIQSILRSCIKL